MKRKIKELAQEDRPREKMILKGISSLTNSELIAILIRSGSGDDSAVELSQKILSFVDDDLSKLSRLSTNDFVNNFKGIGPTKAISLIAAMELGKRIGSSNIESSKITSSKDAYIVFKQMLSGINNEETWVLMLSQSNKILKKKLIAKGGISHTIVDIRLILREALNQYATGIILGHNHPSGNPNPSTHDIDITNRLKEASTIMDIRFLDHIIVCDNSYYSFSDNGYI